MNFKVVLTYHGLERKAGKCVREGVVHFISSACICNST